MVKLPRRPDPERLQRIDPDVFSIPADTTLYRVYSRGGVHPVSWNTFRNFGPLRSRFDHHDLDANGLPTVQSRAILYASLDIPTAFAESFQHGGRAIDRHDREPWIAAFDIGDPLELLDLTDTFAVRAGASVKLMTESVSVSRVWADAFYTAWPTLRGLRYRSSLTGRICVALNERAAETVVNTSSLRLHRGLADPTFLPVVKAAAAQIGFDVL